MKLEKIFAAGTTKNILTPSILKEGLPIKKKKSATDNRKMDIILRKENLGDLETKQVSLIHNKTEIAKSDTTSHRSKI